MVIQTLPPFETMDRVFCVRADNGQNAEAFVRGGYAGLGWDGLDGRDLSQESYDSMRVLLADAYPNVPSRVISDWVGLILRFAHDIRPGDWVLTPDRDSSRVYIGKVVSDYFCQEVHDDPYDHRYRIEWRLDPVLRRALPEAWRRKMHNQRTVFQVAGA